MRNRYSVLREESKKSATNIFYKALKNILFRLFVFFICNNVVKGQVSQFPQVYNNYLGSPSASNLNIRQTPNITGNILIPSGFGIGSKIGGVSLATNPSDPFYTWVQVCLPSTTGNLTYGYIACNEFYARIDPTNDYATVTASPFLNIRTAAGTGNPNVTINGSNAFYGQNSIVALTGVTAVVSGVTWREVYLTTNCSQPKGWLSGSFLSVNGSTTNYRTVGGRVCDNAGSCNTLGNINGATVTFGSIGSTFSSSDFYQYKLPVNWSGSITCTHPSFNTSSPSSYSYVASGHNYTRHFVLSNCAVPATPSNLTVTSTSSTSVSLSWTPVSGSGITYEVLKNVTSCGSAFGSSGLLTSNTFGTVTGLPSNTPHYFRVIARNSCGQSANSNCVTATTSSSTPSPTANFSTPTGIIVSGQATTIFNASSNATSYSWTIERQEWNGSTSTVYTSSSTNINFNFPQAACYWVSLTATNASGSNTMTRPCYIYATPNLTVPIPPDVTRAQKYYTYKGGDPVNLANGSFSFSMRDLSIPDVKTTLLLERRYFSNSGYDGPLGLGWHHSFDIKINFSNNSDWFIQYPDGHNEHFVPYTNGETRTMYPGNFDTLSYTASGGVPTGFTVRLKDGTRWEFNDLGQIRYIFDLDNNQTTFSYSGGKLITITGPGGRFILFTYNGANKIITAKDNSNRTVYYYYDAANQYLDSTRIENSTTGFRYGPYGMTEVYDPRGNRIVQNVYNAQSQVYEQFDAENKKTTFQYNTPAAGQTTVTDPLLKTKVLTHDNNARCIQAKDELNAITSYKYSLDGTLDTITDAKGYKTIKQYDGKGNEIKTSNAKGFSDSLGYTSLNKVNYVRDKENSVYKTNYSVTGNPTEIILPTNDTLKREYDNRGLDTAITDARGYKTRKIYNGFGDLVQTITPTSSTSIVYDAVGRPVEITDSYGRKDSLFWNHFDQLIRRKDKMGRVEEFGFDANGNQVIYKDKKGEITTTQFNKHDKPIRIIEPQNHVTEYEYDDNQRKIKARDANKNTLIFTYDDTGREISVADSVFGILTQRTYDAAGNILTYTNALNKIWTNRVDEINRTTSTINPLGDSIQFKYNKNNLPIEQIDEDGKSTKWEYDAAGRHIKTIDARNNYIQRFLNKNGLIDSVRDARGNIRNKATYDGSDRLITLNDRYGNYTTVWDSSGNVKTITDPNNRIVNHFYNNNNELIDIKNGGNTLRHYLLDNSGDYLEANSGTQNASVLRNQLGWITHYTDNYANTNQYIYDSVGNIKKVIYAGGKPVEYEYNSLNKCIGIKDWTNGVFTITRNNNNEITGIQYSNSFRTEIVRDDASRVSAWINKNGSNTIFHSNLLRRNKTGDILRDSGLHVLPFAPLPQTATGTYGLDDRVQQYGNAVCTTNLSGQRVGLSAPGKFYTYTWSFMSELTSTTHTSPAQSMQYDAFNERTTKTTTQGTTRYIVDHQLASFPLVLQERDNSNQELVNYLYIPGEGIVLARDSAGTFRYYHHDVKGNTIALSDASGQITDRYTYNDFGDSIAHIGNSVQPFTWMGMYGVQHDGHGLYYLHARYFDGKTSTFISKDPHPINYLNTQDVNRYVYGYNNPLKYIDPTGLYSLNIVDQSWIQKFALSNAGIRTAKILEGLLKGYHAGLDILGLVPGLGEPADFYNGILYGIRGDKLNAGLSFLGTVPIAGWGATVGKYSNKLYDANRSIRNIDLAGGVHPKSGIPFDANGFPDFTNNLYKSGQNDVIITPTKNRLLDEVAANTAAGYTKTPAGYTWHHHQQTGRMQLVETTIHRQTGHTGGYSIWGQ